LDWDLVWWVHGQLLTQQPTMMAAVDTTEREKHFPIHLIQLYGCFSVYLGETHLRSQIEKSIFYFTGGALWRLR
jgi:hypothetical protein